MFAVLVFASLIALALPIVCLRQPLLKVAATGAAMALAVAAAPHAHAHAVEVGFLAGTVPALLYRE